LEGDEWAGRFRSFKREAFRLETLPQYLVPQEHDAFTAFKETGAVPVINDEPGGWQDTIRRAYARGARMRRVHVVTEPLSDYLRFEFTCYVPNVDAGEEIRILDLGKTGPLNLPDFDFWMFDEAEVVHMMYELDGTQTGRKLLDTPDVVQILAWRDLAWDHSISFTEYWNARS
jgi:hypothetical protein